MAAVEYIISRFPLTDDVLKHAKFVDFEKRESSEFSDVEYFIGLYSKILDMNFDDIFDEFVAFQLLASSDIPQSVWESAKEKIENDYQEFVRMDKIWAFLSTMKTGDGCNLRFPQLSKVAKLVLRLWYGLWS